MTVDAKLKPETMFTFSDGSTITYHSKDQSWETTVNDDSQAEAMSRLIGELMSRRYRRGLNNADR
jgi:hypothetical protein